MFRIRPIFSRLALLRSPKVLPSNRLYTTHQDLLYRSHIEPLTEAGRENASDRTSSDDVGLEPVKKRPGRPRKGEVRPATVIVKKKVGRPKKHDSKPECEVKDTSESIKSDIEVEVEEKELRGRKKSVTPRKAEKPKPDRLEQNVDEERTAQKGPTGQDGSDLTPQAGDLKSATKNAVVGALSKYELQKLENPSSFKPMPRRDTSAEWKDKEGLLFTPLKTGFPKADRIAAIIRDGYGGAGRLGRKQGDVKRIHVVRKQLCDDILNRLRPSLEKHVGCDIIELNPGPGVWTSAIHNILKPRTHILLEPDFKLFEPLLQPLLDAPRSTYKVVPRLGYSWDVLESILTPEFLPHQKPLKRNDPRFEEPNNTLLFIANLGFYPRKAYRGFSSVPDLVMHQLLSAARAHSLIHKYGSVRMLIWVADDAKHSVFPRNIADRKKSAIEAEITCSDIAEIAGSNSIPSRRGIREHHLDIESCLATLRKMEASHVATPAGRETPLLREAMQASEAGQIRDEMQIVRPFLVELADMEARYAAGEFKMFRDVEIEEKGARDFWSPEYVRLRNLRAKELKRIKRGKPMKDKYIEELKLLRSRFESGEVSRYTIPKSEIPKRTILRGPNYYTPEYLALYRLQGRRAKENSAHSKSDILVDELQNIIEMQKKQLAMKGDNSESGAASLLEEIVQRTQILKDKIQETGEETSKLFALRSDNRRAFYQDPPILLKDRRQVEPLMVQAAEFFPRHEMALLDFQPQPLWPVLRDDLAETYDVLEFIIGHLTLNGRKPVSQGLKSLYPGALEWLVAECPSLTDPNKGGTFDLDLLPAFLLTAEMYKEIIEAWVRWPFRPSMTEFYRRMGTASRFDGELVHQDLDDLDEYLVSEDIEAEHDI